MLIMRLDHDTICAGRDVFKMYFARVTCGTGSFAYCRGEERSTGAYGIVGCVMACLDHGLTNEDDIVPAVARATRCRRSTVEAFLDFLRGDDPAKHLWQLVRGHYRCLEGASVLGEDRTQVLLAA